MAIGYTQPVLHEGCLRAILMGTQVDKPLVQLLESRCVNNGRYRLLLNDGRNTFSFAMLATQLNPLMESGELSSFAVIRLLSKSLIIVLEVAVEVPGADIGTKLGNPIPLGENGQPAGPPAGGSGAVPQAGSPARAQIRAPNPQAGFGSPSNSMAGNRPPGNPYAQANLPAAKRPNLGGNIQQNFQPRPSGSANSFPSTSAGSFRPSFPNAPPRASAGASFGPRFPTGQQQFPGQTSTQSFSSESVPLVPIAALNPYQGGKWKICVKVLSKDAIREWQKGDRSGRVFGCIVSDGEQSIKVSAFNEDADRFYEVLEVGKDFYISNGTIKTADSRYSQGRPYDMTLGSSSDIQPCTDHVQELQIRYNFIPISDLQNAPPKASVDVIGVAKSIGEIFEGTAKSTGKNFKKRDFELVDSSGFSVRASLWGNKVDSINKENEGQVVAVKGASTSDFGGCTLSIGGESMLQISPEIQEAFQLTGWLQANGDALAQTQSISQTFGAGGLSQTEWRTLLDANMDNNIGDKGLYFMAKATIMKVFYRPNTIYPGCPRCNKKMVMANTDTYSCEQCQMESKEVKWRLMLQVEIADFTGSIYATLFDSAEKILNQTAENLGALKQNNESELEKLCLSAQFKTFRFKIRAKMENWQDEQRKKFMVITAEDINVEQEAQRLIAELEKLGITADAATY